MDALRNIISLLIPSLIKIYSLSLSDETEQDRPYVNLLAIILRTKSLIHRLIKTECRMLLTVSVSHIHEKNTVYFF